MKNINKMIWIVCKFGGRIDLKGRQDSYDERQLLVRGQAYKAAFFTLIAFVTLASLMSELFEIPLFMSFCGMWIGVCFSIVVFAIICIWKEAYMSLYQNAKGVILIFSFVGIMNIGAGIRVILEKRPMLENGAISIDCTNLVVGILFWLVFIVFCARLIYNKKHSEEEEEESSL